MSGTAPPRKDGLAPKALAQGSPSAVELPKPRGGCWSRFHGRHQAAKWTSPGATQCCCPTEVGGESVVGSQRAFPLTSWAGMCPPAAHRVTPVPQQGMTGVEPLPYSPPDVAWTQGALRSVHRLVLKAEGQGYVAKPCHHQPLAISSCPCAVPDPVTVRHCRTRQLSSALGHPLRCHPPIRAQLPGALSKG